MFVLWWKATLIDNKTSRKGISLYSSRNQILFIVSFFSDTLCLGSSLNWVAEILHRFIKEFKKL